MGLKRQGRKDIAEVSTKILNKCIKECGCGYFLFKNILK